MKLYLEVKFYTLVLFIVFCAIGKQEISFYNCFRALFGVALLMGKSFTTSFLALFLLIPFINRLINSMDQRSHKRLLITLLVIFTIAGSFFLNDFFEYIGWYVTVYLIGAYLRLYPIAWLQSVKNCSLLAAMSLSLCLASILFFTYFCHSFGIYYLVADSNRILAILSAVALFSLFRSVNLGQIRWINYMSSPIFGIFLIHTDRNVRPWLWENAFSVKEWFYNDWLWLHAVSAVIIVYIVCFVLDIIRQEIIEKPLFACLDKKFPALSKGIK